LKLLRTINRLKDPRDLWLFLQILTTIILLPRLIRRKSLPDLLKDLDPGVSPRETDPGVSAGEPDHHVSAREPDRDQMEKTVGFADSLLCSRVFQRYGKCLLRSLILFRFLRRQGWPVEIHFGVRKTGEPGNEDVRTSHIDITGHSWLVLDGEPFLEEENQQGSFATTYTYAG